MGGKFLEEIKELGLSHEEVLDILKNHKEQSQQESSTENEEEEGDEEEEEEIEEAATEKDTKPIEDLKKEIEGLKKEMKKMAYKRKKSPPQGERKKGHVPEPQIQKNLYEVKI
jgi:DNA-binding transcriptional MerR regulator